MKKNLNHLFITILMVFAPLLSANGSLFSKPKNFSLPKEITGHDTLQNKGLKWNFTQSPVKTKTIGTIISFLSFKCPCSNSHLNHLKELQKNFPQFSFIGIHSNKRGNKKDIQSFVQKKKLTFPVLLDSQLKLANAFRAIKTPHIFVISNKGQLLFHGGITNSINFKFATKFYLKEALTKLLRKEPLEKYYARAIGCSISR
jgi:hypothetical protein